MTPAGGSTLSVTMSNDDDRRGAQIWEVLTQEDRLLEIGGNAMAVAQNGKSRPQGAGVSGGGMDYLPPTPLSAWVIFA